MKGSLFVVLSFALLQTAYATPSYSQGDGKTSTSSLNDAQLMTQGMWRDPKTNMIWMRCSLGQRWTGSTCTGEASRHTWQAAQDAVAAMNRNGGFGGHTDWVVPPIEDLSSIRYCSTRFEATTEIPAKKGGTKTIDWYCKNGQQRPTIDQTIFPNTPARVYWSASPNDRDNGAWFVDLDSGNDAWFVDFGDGGTGYYGKDLNSFVRAVRASQ